MAFVSRADRKLHDPAANLVGPGAYINPSTYSSNPSFAPFSSTSERKSFKPQQAQTPGPGSYNLAQAGANTPQDQFGKTKFSSSFANQNPRLPSSASEKAPGPGAYQIRDSWKASKKIVKNSASASWTRVPSAPSIPAFHQAYGYDETTSGELIMQKNPEKTYAGTGKDSVGPGHYSVSNSKMLGGPKWHKYSEKRTLAYQCDSTGPDLGPGYYNESDSKQGPLYKYKQNAVFMSRFKEELLEVKDNSLGPGYYDADKKKDRVRPAKYQNFGSSSLRFEHKRADSELGPGQYSYSISGNSGGAKVPFASSGSRFRYQSSSTPGPGSYKNPDLVESLTKKPWGKQGVFGSSEKRFVPKRNEKTPGPGHYPLNTDKFIGSHSCVYEKPHAVFLSKSNRTKSVKSFVPPPGNYEVKSAFTTSTKKATSLHPALSKVTRCNSEMDLGFASKAERFNDKRHKKFLNPGPGSYDVKAKKDDKKVIVALESRFKEKKKEGPGPGSYVEDGDKWNRKSFNVLFSEVG